MEIYIDTGSLDDIKRYRKKGGVKGFTTNPSLIRNQHGPASYMEFAREAVALADGLSISLEVLSSDPDVMRAQARELARIGENVVVKIPAYSSNGKENANLAQELEEDGVPVNFTAVLSSSTVPVGMKVSIVSVFAGRIADTSRHPELYVLNVRDRVHPATKVLWASAREVLNVKTAAASAADIITLSPAIFDKWKANFRRNLYDLEVATSKEFEVAGAEIPWMR